ncbi:MAG: DNA-binding transcriptional LysR family regulator, partial [Oleiphilaceae bacterium]
MNRFFMELSDLRIFKAVVETGGISRAAEMLNRVPSNITARIQKLESELGKNLFIREKNRLRVSPSGEQLFIYAKKILLLANEALEQLNHEHPKGKLRLGSMEAVAASRLSSVLMGYHKNFPEVSLEVITGPTGKLIEQVLSGDLDLALVADPPKDKRLDTTPIFIETLVLVSDLSL